MSNHEDPFASPDSERTIIMPSPGRRVTGVTPPAAGCETASNHAYTADAPAATGINPLAAAANPLLNIIPQLRTTLSHPDSSGLRDHLIQNIKAFETRAKTAGVTPENIIAARYVLCTVLDETASSTPWGGSGMWAKHSLLVLFHKESWGGEKFFQLLSKLAENPTANRDLLELMYICLALGFEGRYRVIDNGRAQLGAVRERLAQILGNIRGEYERDLSPHWRGVTTERSRIFDALPFWIVAAISMAILLSVYIGFRYQLGDLSDSAYARIQALHSSTSAPVITDVPPAPAAPRLATFLTQEISAGRVAVSDENNKSVITILGDDLFKPGSTSVSAQYLPLLENIASALNSVQGQILVIGHTDNQPIRSLRFPSNWHLSEERARSVMRILTQTVAVDRLSSAGRADAEPIADNSSPEGRSRNRRVEIKLFIGGKGS